MPAHHLLEDGHRPNAGGRLQQGYDLRVENGGKRIGTPAAPHSLLLRRQSRIGLDAIGRGDAERCLCRRSGCRMDLTELHEEPHLVIGYVAAGHKAIPPNRKTTGIPGRPRSPESPFEKERRRGVETPVGLRPSFVPAPRRSHLDCRYALNLFVAPHGISSPLRRIGWVRCVGPHAERTAKVLAHGQVSSRESLCLVGTPTAHADVLPAPQDAEADGPLDRLQDHGAAPPCHELTGKPVADGWRGLVSDPRTSITSAP